MKYAPIIIPTLCRSEHFIRCIESLKKNTWANKTDVYIALDYPAKESHFEGYNKILEYLTTQTFEEFASFIVIKREENYGPGKNFTLARELVFETNDRFIRTDDDIEFSPNFLEYMDKCLERYENDPNVIAVSGYSYPIDWEVTEGSTVLKQSFVASMWGTGFWKEKYLNVVKEITEDHIIANEFDTQLKTGLKKRVTDLCFKEIFSTRSAKFDPQRSFICKTTDVALRAYCGMFGYQVIIPTISKSRNYGFDGSGIYCQKNKEQKGKVTSLNYAFAMQPIDESEDFEIVEDTLNSNIANMKKFNKFDDHGFWFNFKSNLKFFVYKLLGEKLYKKMQKIIDKQKRRRHE